LKAIQEYIEENEKVYVFFGESKHKIKKKAEQQACKIAIEQINK
jgi:UDP-N-acetylmuramoylalanine-D-glutamate ligase